MMVFNYWSKLKEAVAALIVFEGVEGCGKTTNYSEREWF